MKRASIVLKGLVMLLLVFGFVGCDTLESLNPFDSEKEVSGIVEAVDLVANSLTVEGIDYAVTDKTEFEGFESLSELVPGVSEVEIEYKENGGSREAVEIELAGAEDNN